MNNIAPIARRQFGFGLGFVLFLLIATPANGIAQNQTPSVGDFVKHGEFSLAMQSADNLPPTVSDEAFRQIAFAQMLGGAQSGAWQTANRIRDDRQRNDSLGGLFQPTGMANAGGITEADFQPLIDLIQSTIAPDEWSDTGQGDGTIQPWPAGVYVDATGTMRKLRTDQKGELAALSATIPASQLGIESHVQTNSRAISLVQLERAAQLLAAQGKSLTPWMKNLGGLYEIDFLIVRRDSNDILLVGPAGPWHLDSENRPVNTATGRAVLQLDDLVVAIRNAREQNGIFGCAITPRQENLAAAKDLIANSKLVGASWREALRTALGQQDVEVFGIPAETHMASVLLEADYRMKLVGMGIEPSVAEVPSYLDRVKLLPDGSAPPLDVARWWFTLNYDEVVTDPERLVFSFKGTGVQVLAETEFVNAQGERIHTGQAQGPTKAFATDFTRHFESIAKKYPVYDQLRGVFDLAIVAALIDRERLAEKANWNMTYFGSDPIRDRLTYQPQHTHVARKVDSVMNHRLIKARTNGKSMQHTIVGVSGGVHCNLDEFFKSAKYRQNDVADVGQQTENFVLENADSRGWWQ